MHRPISVLLRRRPPSARSFPPTRSLPPAIKICRRQKRRRPRERRSSRYKSCNSRRRRCRRRWRRNFRTPRSDLVLRRLFLRFRMQRNGEGENWTKLVSVPSRNVFFAHEFGPQRTSKASDASFGRAMRAPFLYPCSIVPFMARGAAIKKSPFAGGRPETWTEGKVCSEWGNLDCTSSSILASAAWWERDDTLEYRREFLALSRRGSSSFYPPLFDSLFRTFLHPLPSSPPSFGSEEARGRGGGPGKRVVN